MTFHIITIFPGMFDSYFGESILARAIADKKIIVKFYNPRDFSTNKHHNIDDTPYGGGPGMVMQVEPIVRAWSKARGRSQKKKFTTYIFSPGGEQFSNEIARDVVGEYTDIILICGRYEGIDARVREITGAQELSIGPYVLTGGEVPAMVVVDAMARQVPGVLGNAESPEEERIASHDMYTRPAEFKWKGKDYTVPEVLLSGDHKKIDEWRNQRRSQ